MPIFDLWDVASGNQLGAWESETEAMKFVRDLVAENEGDLIADLALGRRDAQVARTVTEGDALLRWMKALPAA